MKQRTLTGKTRPPLRKGHGTTARARRTRAEGARRLGAAGRGSLAAVPWALALLGASAMLATATVLAH